jgi:glycogen operon protein
VYAYRVYCSDKSGQGHRFDPDKVVLDPYAKAIVGAEIYDRQAASEKGDNCHRALRGLVVDTLAAMIGKMTNRYALPTLPVLSTKCTSVVLPVTRIPALARKRGTFAGLIEKIPYLKNLGITAVELLPIHYFDPASAMPGLTNYWGYSTIGFFAPHAGYSSDRSPFGPLNEFREFW